MRLYTGAGLSILDLCTDLFMIYTYATTGQEGTALSLAIMVGLNVFFQLLLTFIVRPTPAQNLLRFPRTNPTRAGEAEGIEAHAAQGDAHCAERHRTGRSRHACCQWDGAERTDGVRAGANGLRASEPRVNEPRAGEVGRERGSRAASGGAGPRAKGPRANGPRTKRAQRRRVSTVVPGLIVLSVPPPSLFLRSLRSHVA